MFVKRIPGLILRLLYPPVCPFCGRPVRVSKDEPDGICHRCRSVIAPVREPYCLKCGKPVDGDDSEYCYDCSHRYHIFEQGRALYPHTGLAKQAVYDLKYAGKRVNGEIFGREMAVHFERWIRARNISLIVPVPLHKKRLAERGYNQAAVIAASLTRELSVLRGGTRGRHYAGGGRCLTPVFREDVLRRTAPTKRLKTMGPAGRRHALEGVFKADLSGIEPAVRENVLLVDDIFTTGSTADAAAGALKRAGAKNVYFLTVTIGRGT